jgi:hypothetical protein
MEDASIVSLAPASYVTQMTIYTYAMSVLTCIFHHQQPYLSNHPIIADHTALGRSQAAHLCLLYVPYPQQNKQTPPLHPWPPTFIKPLKSYIMCTCSRTSQECPGCQHKVLGNLNSPIACPEATARSILCDWRYATSIRVTTLRKQFAVCQRKRDRAEIAAAKEARERPQPPPLPPPSAAGVAKEGRHGRPWAL